MTQPSQSFTPAEADKIAASIAPSWFEVFGPPGDPRAVSAALSPDAIAARAAEALDPTGNRQGQAQPSEPPPPAIMTSSAPPPRAVAAVPSNAPPFRSVRPAAADLPRAPMPWGMIAGATVGVAALVAAIVVFTGGEDAAPAARDTASSPSSRPDPKKSAAPAATSATPTPAPPAPAEPPPKTEEPAPEPSAVDPVPEPAPPQVQPQPTPKATPPRPTPAPRPKQPPPSPKPGSGDIVRKAPF